MGLKFKTKEFKPAPAGLRSAVLVDYVDLGDVTKSWGTKHQVKLVWEVDATLDDGQPILVWRDYNMSSHRDSDIIKALGSWRGRVLSAQEIRGLDFDDLLGQPCTLAITHNETDRGTFADVDAIYTASAVKLQPSGLYRRPERWAAIAQNPPPPVLKRLELVQEQDEERDSVEPAGVELAEADNDDVPF
jgi:hypothetical protein